MLTLRPADKRGAFNHGWLDTRHTFSFGRYDHPEHRGFGPLLVINEDRVAPAKGFPKHPHDHMEILSYVVAGRLTHQDSAGHSATVGPGGIQLMSAGTGLEHSEFNGSKVDPVHFLQVWIQPARRGTTPRYSQADAPPGNPFRLVAAPDAAMGDRDGPLAIGQDARVFAGVLAASAAQTIDLAPGRSAWVQLVRGQLRVKGQTLKPGDGLALSAEARFEIHAAEESELLAFDLP